MNWMQQMRNRLTAYDDLKNRITLMPGECEYESHPGRKENLPLSVTDYYWGLMTGDPDDPVRRQCVPRVDEFKTMDYETGDPLGERYFSPVPRMVHQYPGRILVKVTDKCAVYCRHCFRRSFAGGKAGSIGKGELLAISEYLSTRPEIREILLSGGDCLVLSDERLARTIDILKSDGIPRSIRLCTRMPVVLPSRISRELLEVLTPRGPFWLVTQYNHPRELTPESLESLALLIDNGIPVVNQTVLLKGVNDSAGILVKLFEELVAARVKPVYLFQGDLAAGTAHFRVNLDRGLRLMKELRGRLSGLALPVYALDLPGGGGKIPLTDGGYLRDETDDPGSRRWRVFAGPKGREYRYPLEEETN